MGRGIELRQQVQCNRGHRDLAADEGLDVRQPDGVFLAAEADRIAFGAGPEASYITGANLTVDGGTNA